jgi:hypothetical protein
MVQEKIGQFPVLVGFHGALISGFLAVLPAA